MSRLKEILIFILLCSSTLFGHYETVSYSINLNDKTVSLENPIRRSENKRLFIAASEITKLFGGEIDYNRKTDTYDISIPSLNINCVIIPFSEEAIINKKPSTLSDKIRIIEGIPYVPIPDFLSRIGLLCTVSNNRVHVKNPNLRKISTPKLLNTSKILPKFKSNEIVFLSIFGKKYDISKEFINENDQVFINLSNILKSFGFIVLENPQKLTLSYNNKTYTFTSNKKQEFFENKGLYYINFETFINKLDLDFIWSNDNHELMILNKITDIKYVSNSENKIIKINSKFPISFSKSTPTIFNQGYYFEFPAASTSLSFQPVKLQNSSQPDYQITMPTPYTVRISIFIPHNTLLPFLIASDEGASISFNTILSGIEQIITQNKSIISLKSGTALKPSIRHYSSENKLIIDIENSYNRLPQKLESDSEFFTKIRTSQFSYTPLSTRIVCDLTDNTFEISTKQTESGVQIIFSKPTNIAKNQQVTLSAPEPSKKTKQTLSSRKTNITSISDKVIVIDAGHGGRDPGAMVKHRYQEKEFTLDIAQQVQELLAKDGAFVVLTRSDDSSLELSSRTDLANENKADLFVSIHFNSHFRARTNGIESYYYKDEDRELATAIQNKLKTRLSFQDKGVKKARFYVLRNTEMPATLLELGYLTNRRDFSKIQSESYRKRMAEAIYLGILDYLKQKRD